MRSLSRRRLADGFSVLLAGALLNVAVFQALRVSPEKLALFAAVAIAAEAIQRREHELLPDALGGERFSLTSPIQIAAILVAGPWVGAAVAGWSVVAVGLFRSFELRRLLGHAGALAAAALAGGFAFEMAGGIVGTLRLPDDLMPAVLAGLVYVTVRTLLEGVVTRRASLPDLVTSASAVGLGIALGFAALYELWLAFALAPMLLLVERLYARVVALRGEMATALETFANIVDERDASTYGHSLRVANYVNELAASLGLPRSEVRRLWWAGRLHDLGKVAVDASVLGKPGKLSPAEWGTVWRAPRLSARLLQRFRFAAQQAQAVEYHRERFNGTGYYRVSQENIPLAAHFLILADAFDAMTTDKPFRERMGREQALAEIERESGSQFHPVIAKAFVAVQRGQDPADVLTAEELAELRDASVPPPSTLPTLGELFRRPEVTALAGGALLLVGLGTTIFPLAVAGVLTTLVGLKLWHSRRRRVARLTQGARRELQSRGRPRADVRRLRRRDRQAERLAPRLRRIRGVGARTAQAGRPSSSAARTGPRTRRSSAGSSARRSPAGASSSTRASSCRASPSRPRCRCAGTTARWSASSSSVARRSLRLTSSPLSRRVSTRSGPRSARLVLPTCSGCGRRT